MSHQNPCSFFWSVADLLRGDYKQSEYGRVILRFTVVQLLYAQTLVQKTMEPEVLQRQAANNSKEQLASSPDLTSEILTAVMDSMLDESADVEVFWQNVKTNLQAGKIRIVVVADEIPS